MQGFDLVYVIRASSGSEGVLNFKTFNKYQVVAQRIETNSEHEALLKYFSVINPVNGSSWSSLRVDLNVGEFEFRVDHH